MFLALPKFNSLRRLSSSVILIVLQLPSARVYASETADAGGDGQVTAISEATQLLPALESSGDNSIMLSQSTKQIQSLARPNPKLCKTTDIPSYDNAIQEMLKEVEGGVSKAGKAYTRDGFHSVFGLGDSGDEQRDPNCRAGSLGSLDRRDSSLALRCAEYCFNKFYLKNSPTRLQVMQDLLKNGGPQDVFAYSQLVIFKPAWADKYLSEWGGSASGALKQLQTPSGAQDFVSFIMEQEKKDIRKLGDSNGVSASARMGRMAKTSAVLSCYNSEQACHYDLVTTDAGDVVAAMKSGSGLPATPINLLEATPTTAVATLNSALPVNPTLSVQTPSFTSVNAVAEIETQNLASAAAPSHQTFAEVASPTVPPMAASLPVRAVSSQRRLTLASFSSNPTRIRQPSSVAVSSTTNFAYESSKRPAPRQISYHTITGTPIQTNGDTTETLLASDDE